MHSIRMDEPDGLRPTNVLEEADRLMEQAGALYENHKQIMKPINRTVAEDKMTWAKDFRHGVEEKSWMDQAEQAKLYFNQAQEALETVKKCVDKEIEIRCPNDHGTPFMQGAGTASVVGNWGLCKRDLELSKYGILFLY
ncbi:hypothetical protein EDB86DRAFT_2832242 [Lactarius hatsudake]|nr:hypothetical protein EDB86DRAFT_2832242 [Lactarius hatsudake]